MVSLTLNGKRVEAESGTMLLSLIKQQSIDIPSICHHDAVEPYGGCRLCTVEISKDDWDGWKKLVVSCLYPVEEGLIVTTHSDKVNDLRKTLMDLYLARSPHSKVIQEIAAQYGVTVSSFHVIEDGDDCILCALCTRVCDRMGFFAISSVNRGHGKEIAPPLHQPPADCTGCISCAQICPTDFIKYEDKGSTRTIWGKTFEMQMCEGSGKPIITKEFAEYLSKQRNIPIEYFKKDDEGHRIELAQTMGKIAQWERED